jgi:hypothetical protein
VKSKKWVTMFYIRTHINKKQTIIVIASHLNGVNLQTLKFIVVNNILMRKRKTVFIKDKNIR